MRRERTRNPGAENLCDFHAYLPAAELPHEVGEGPAGNGRRR
jgi:hypothetical protein